MLPYLVERVGGNAPNYASEAILIPVKGLN